MESTVFVFLCRLAFFRQHAESLERLGFGRGGEGIKRQVVVPALSQQVLHHAVALLLQFFLSLLFKFGHLAQCLVGVCQCGLHFFGALAALTAMCLIHDDGIALAAP